MAAYAIALKQKRIIALFLAEFYDDATMLNSLVFTGSGPHISDFIHGN